jgi:hypothetical protein
MFRKLRRASGLIAQSQDSTSEKHRMRPRLVSKTDCVMSRQAMQFRLRGEVLSTKHVSKYQCRYKITTTYIVSRTSQIRESTSSRFPPPRLVSRSQILIEGRQSFLLFQAPHPNFEQQRHQATSSRSWKTSSRVSPAKIAVLDGTNIPASDVPIVQFCCKRLEDAPAVILHCFHRCHTCLCELNGSVCSLEYP